MERHRVARPSYSPTSFSSFVYEQHNVCTTVFVAHPLKLSIVPPLGAVHAPLLPLAVSPSPLPQGPSRAGPFP